LAKWVAIVLSFQRTAGVRGGSCSDDDGVVMLAPETEIPKAAP
jgi:hypothetical protein